MNSSQTTHLLRCLLFITPQLRLPSQAKQAGSPSPSVVVVFQTRQERWSCLWLHRRDGGVEIRKLGYIYVRQVSGAGSCDHTLLVGWVAAGGAVGRRGRRRRQRSYEHPSSQRSLVRHAHTHTQKSKGVLFYSAEAGNVHQTRTCVSIRQQRVGVGALGAQLKLPHVPHHCCGVIGLLQGIKNKKQTHKKAFKTTPRLRQTRDELLLKARSS